MSNEWGDFNNADIQNSNQKQVEEIRSRALTNIHAILRYLLPNGRFHHDRFVVGSLQGEVGKSLVVTITGDKTGMWHDFNTGEGGDIFDLWANIYGLDAKRNFSRLLEDVEGWLGGDYIEIHKPLHTEKPLPAMDNLGPVTGKWDYKDAQGALIACVYRYDPEGGKEFRPWDVKTRKYQAPNPRPLYNQLGMLNEKQVILVEGEKSAQSLINIDICATTAMNGAKAPIDKTDWSPLAGKEVLIWPDKDKAGWDYANNVAVALQEIGVTKLAILHPPLEKAEKWDAADAIAEGMDIRDFLGTAHREEIQTKKYSINLRDWSGENYDGDASVEKFLVADTFPIGKTSILAGMGDTGKGLLTLNLALHVATGSPQTNSMSPEPIAFGNAVREFGTAVILTAEDDRDEIHRRLEKLDPLRHRSKHNHKLIIVPLPNAGGAFPIIQETPSGHELTKHFAEIRAQLLQIHDLKLVVFDPLASFTQADINASPAAGSYVTTQLAALASDTKSSVLIAHHMRKPANGKPIEVAEQARDAIRGTSALVDGVRLAYALWPASSEHQHAVYHSLKEPFDRNSVYQGAVVKSNSPADRTIRTYLRDKKTGLLVDITQKLKDFKMPSDEMEELLIKSIARSAISGHPFTHTGGAGLYKQHNRLPACFHNLGRNRLEAMAMKLMNARPPLIVKGKASGSKEDKWLDVPDGPFAKGVGEFEHGAEVFHDVI